VRRRVVGLGLVLLASGCHNFTVVNGGKVAASQPASGYDERFHSAIIGDFVMIDQPPKLDTLCPMGWAKIDRQVSFFNGAVNMLGGGVYQSDSITVRCVKGQPVNPDGTPVVAPAPSGTPNAPPGTPNMPPSQPPAQNPAPTPGVSL
jgi:hypothetical protein